MNDQPSPSAAGLPSWMWCIESNRSPILVLAYANVLHGSVVKKSFYGLTRRGCRRRAERWLKERTA